VKDSANSGTVAVTTFRFHTRPDRSDASTMNSCDKTMLTTSMAGHRSFVYMTALLQTPATISRLYSLFQITVYFKYCFCTLQRSAFLQDFIGFAWASVITSDGQVVDSPSVVESPRTPSAQGATSAVADATWQLQKSPRHTVDFDEQPLPLPKKGSVYHGGLGIGNHGQKPVLYSLMDVQRAVESIRSVYDRNDQKEAASLYASFRVPLQST
jgi:hypothetical protein